MVVETMTDLDIVFRKAKVEDLNDIIGLLADDRLGAKREDNSVPPKDFYTKAFDAITEDKNQFLVVVEREGRVVGVMQLSFIPGLSHKGAWRGQIESVRIHRDERGTGLGQKMFLWAIEMFKDHGCNLVQLTCDKSRNEAHNFYEKLGFRPTHIGFKLTL